MSFISRCTRTGPARWKGTTTATTGPIGRFPNRIAGPSSPLRRQIAAHFRDKHWTETLFQGFLNNKNNFKANGWSRGSSPWLLDEPASFQDLLGASLFRPGLSRRDQPGSRRRSARQSVNRAPRLVFRADISRPQWRSDSLDGLLDYHVVGGAMREYPRLVFERKRTLGEIVLEYGSTNPIEGSNVQPVGWCLDAWSLGTDGDHPLADGRQRRLVEAGRRARAVLSTPGQERDRSVGAGQAAGADSVDPPQGLSPRPAGRRVSDALVAVARTSRGGRSAEQVRAALKLAGTREATGFAGGEDAGRIDYGRLRPQHFWALRVAIGEAISQAHPSAKSKLVDFRTPRRDLKQSPSAATANAE